jgi:hypothetical protein
MVTERIILAIAGALRGSACTTRRTLDLSDTSEPSNPQTSESRYENALPTNDLYDKLLLSFDINEIQGAILWMKLRGYVTTFGYGIIAPEMGLQLTDKGRKFADSKVMPEEDHRRLSGRTVSVKPSMYGITLDPKEIWWRIKKMFSR